LILVTFALLALVLRQRTGSEFVLALISVCSWHAPLPKPKNHIPTGQLAIGFVLSFCTASHTRRFADD
jgi:hypothetical protein